ncbi:MAG: hypothetical protein ACREJO_00455 [Phycisphaerales bacterium]
MRSLFAGMLLTTALLLGAGAERVDSPPAQLRRDVVAAIGSPAGVVMLPRLGAGDGAWTVYASGSVVKSPRFELRIDCEAARAAVEGDFNASTCAGLLDAWGLANGRDAELRAELIPAEHAKVIGADGSERSAQKYAGPPLVRAEASWSARSRPVGTVARALVCDAGWPGVLGIEPPEAAWLAVLRLDALGLGRFGHGVLGGWPGLVRLAIRSIGLAESGKSLPVWEEAESAWMRQHTDVFRAVCGSLGRWVLVGGLASGDGVVVIAEATGSGQRAEAASAEVAKAFGGEVVREGEVYSIRASDDRLVASLAWTVRKIGTRAWIVAVIGADAKTPAAALVAKAAAGLREPRPEKK